VLKARVERRDEEVERLRREVGRLRVLVEEGSAGGEQGEQAEGGGGSEGGLDLERDLDAVEKVGGKGGESKNGHVASSNASAAGGDDVMDEGDDEGDE